MYRQPSVLERSVPFPTDTEDDDGDYGASLTHQHVSCIIVFINAYQTLSYSTNGQIWKTIPGREKKIGECHAIAYGNIHLWYKYQVRKFSNFVKFTFRVLKVHPSPTGTSSLREK